MRVLGFDPGIENFAWCFYDGAPREWGWVPAARVNENDWPFLDRIAEVLDHFRPDVIVIERFVFRDKESVNSEHINHLIGKLDLVARLRGVDTVLPMPSHWKVKLGTKDYASGAKGLFPDVAFEAIHQADAAGLARYVYEQRTDPDFDPETGKVAKTAAGKKRVEAAKAAALEAETDRRRSQLDAGVVTKKVQWTELVALNAKLEKSLESRSSKQTKKKK